MNRIIERDEFISAIDHSYGDVEDSISQNYFYLLIYRLTKEFGTTDGIQVRCAYERILTANLFNENNIRVDDDLKQHLWSYGISFSEDPMSGIIHKDLHKMLMIIPEWTNTSAIEELINQRRESGEYSMVPTDLFVESISSNKEFDDYGKILSGSNLSYLTLWYVRRNNDYYASFKEKDDAYRLIFDDSEIYSIEDDMKRFFDVPYMSVTIVNDLLEFGFRLFKDGFKCLDFNDLVPELRYVDVGQYYALSSMFLVYMSETYNMMINTTYDDMFCKQYNVYRRGDFCLAEDILFSKSDMYYPVMYFTVNDSGRYLYIRSIKDSYTYNYFRSEEIESLLTGNMDVTMHTWSYNSRPTVKPDSILGSKDIYKSDYVEYLKSLEDDSDKYPKVIPLYQCLESEDKIINVVNAINKYNFEKSDSIITKYVTVRDLLCRKVLDGDKEIIQIGYIQSNGNYAYNNRLRQDLVVSDIRMNNASPVSCVTVGLSRNYNEHLYPVRYVFDISYNAPKSLMNVINDTESMYRDMPDIEDVSESGEFERQYSRAEKFVYYTCSVYMQKGVYAQLVSSLTGDLTEYKSALYRGVYTVAKVLPEFVKEFSDGGLNNLIGADLLDAYGNISDEYISVTNTGDAYFNIKNKLFGILTME